MKKKTCFVISKINDAEKLLLSSNYQSSITIFFIKNYLIKGFGIEWLKTMKVVLKKKFKNHKIEYYVDSGYDYGLCINLIKQKIKYIKLKSNKIILHKIKEIAKKNKVVLNPDFNVLDISNIKKIDKKLKHL